MIEIPQSPLKLDSTRLHVPSGDCHICWLVRPCVASRSSRPRSPSRRASAAVDRYRFGTTAPATAGKYTIYLRLPGVRPAKKGRRANDLCRPYIAFEVPGRR